MKKLTCCCCAGDERLRGDPATVRGVEIAGQDAPAGCAFTVGHSTRPIDKFIGEAASA